GGEVGRRDFHRPRRARPVRKALAHRGARMGDRGAAVETSWDGTIRSLLMRRYSSSLTSTYSFGPGRMPTAIKILIAVNVAVFFAQLIQPSLTELLGLVPMYVVRKLWVWQVATYMFLHGGMLHILFN